ncbi:PREDICTED: piriformospora indica-insensitive protein 2 isoform X1 [Theobroma cacao]|uniref:Piriformospora indica-insensitive protein 2 isoform X1 n=2 Tax=Theobroma cacao TaxID=3641 RepID=A0AB32V186_THECC|nr:PREDICTED: piriformospora indica-insensitive protein 2 isoform X1 [Theobroma cacao]
MASLSLFLVGFGFLVLACGAIAVQRNLDESEMVMEEGELLGLFDVMGSLLEEPGWAEVHPEPCTDTPWPGVECEIGQDPPIFHVTTIHIGPDVATPPCKPSAKISDSLPKLPYLTTLSIFNCFVTSQVTLSPALFGSLSSLEHLSLQSNPSLSGEVPPSLAKISGLKVISLSQNNLQGNIPRELGGLVNLEQLDLSYNNLSGEIPEDIGGLKSLTILDLSSNGLEGPVPFSLGQLQRLQKVDLCSNRLHGRIPPEFGKLNRLVLLDLSHNFINGPIPETLSGLEQLQYLIFDYNPINALMPLFVGSLKRLASISFSGCGLMGPIPNSLSSLKNLTALSLDNNSLTGTIPPSLGSLPNLDQLNLSHNKLSGELLLSEEFIKRLGKRLDVRGNSRLCTSYQLSRKNISTYLQTPACLDTEGIVDNRTCPEEQPDDFKGRKPYWYYGQTSSRAPLQDPQFISTCFVLFHVLSFL